MASGNVQKHSLVDYYLYLNELQLPWYSSAHLNQVYLES